MKKNSGAVADKNILDIISEELWEIRNPSSDSAKNAEEVSSIKKKLTRDNDNYKSRRALEDIYLPQRKHFQELVTSRNKHLISEKEQEKLGSTVVAFFGLSVGSNAASVWMMLSRANKIKVSDPDIITPSNLNRLRYGWREIGRLKADVVEEELQGINPYCKVYKHNNKSGKAVEKMILENPKPHIIVDCMDDLEMKVLVRNLAKKTKIPVIMATDVGDNVFLDIERYDKIPQPELFNGRVKDIENIELSTLSRVEKIKLSMNIVGLEHNAERMMESLNSIGKTIRTWPQLGSTAAVAGGLIVTTIKKIILGEKLDSGRYYLDLEQIMVSDFNSSKRKKKRKILKEKITSRLD